MENGVSKLRPEPFDPSTLLRAGYAQDAPVEGIKLTQFGKMVSAVLRGPVLGLDMEYVYIFWSLEQRSLEPGTARSYFGLGEVPTDQPSVSASERFLQDRPCLSADWPSLPPPR